MHRIRRRHAGSRSPDAWMPSSRMNSTCARTAASSSGSSTRPSLSSRSGTVRRQRRGHQRLRQLDIQVVLVVAGLDWRSASTSARSLRWSAAPFSPPCARSAHGRERRASWISSDTSEAAMPAVASTLADAVSTLLRGLQGGRGLLVRSNCRAPARSVKVPPMSTARRAVTG